MSGKVTHLKRPSLERSGPKRATGTLYRTADNKKTGLGGVTLESAEDAMVAAVRMAYDVADSQIARSKRLAERLKGAADRATGNDPKDGQRSAEDAVDGASRLVNNAMLSGMTWVEALMGADDGLGPRLAAAQLRAVKSVLFGAREARETDAGPDIPPAPTHAATERRATVPDVRIILRDAEEDRRPVTIRRWEMTRPIDSKLYFRLVGGAAEHERVSGAIKRAEQAVPTLEIDPLPAAAVSGRWRAAVCDKAGEQHGIVEIEI